MAFIFEVKVTPSSGKKGWLMDKSGVLKVYLKSPPEQGKANQELIKNIANALGITQDCVSIIAGKQSRRKKIRVDCEIDMNILLQALGVEWQMDMF